MHDQKQPWLDYDSRAGYAPAPNNSWRAAEWPFVVRWDVPVNDRPTRWISHVRHFQRLEDAVTAYKRPFRGLSVDLVAYNGKPPGYHLDTLARRKAGKPTTWSNIVPAEMR